MEYFPIVIPQITVALAPIEAPFSTFVGITFQSVAKALGCRSFVNVAPGPTKTSFSIVTPLKTETLFWIFTLSPIEVSWSMNTFFAITQFEPNFAPVLIWLLCQIFEPSPIVLPSSTNADSCIKTLTVTKISGAALCRSVWAVQPGRVASSSV
jgi:hypothetical protein